MLLGMSTTSCSVGLRPSIFMAWWRSYQKQKCTRLKGNCKIYLNMFLRSAILGLQLTQGFIVAPLSPVSNDLKTAVTHSSSLSVSMFLGLAMVLDVLRSLFPPLFSSFLFFSSCSLICWVMASYSPCLKVVIFSSTGRVLGTKLNIPIMFAKLSPIPSSDQACSYYWQYCLLLYF